MRLGASGKDPSDPTPVDSSLLDANQRSYQSKRSDLNQKLFAFLAPIAESVEIDPASEHVRPVRDLIAQFNPALVRNSGHRAGQVSRTTEKIGASIEKSRDPKAAIVSVWNHHTDLDESGISISLRALDFDSLANQANSRAVTYGGQHESFIGEAANVVMICYPSIDSNGNRRSEAYANLLQMSEGAFDLSLSRAVRERDKLEFRKERSKSPFVAKVELGSLVAKQAVRFSTGILNRENQAAVGMADMAVDADIFRLGIVGIDLGGYDSRWSVIVPEMVHHKFEIMAYLDKNSFLKCDLVSRSAESFCVT